MAGPHPGCALPTCSCCPPTCWAGEHGHGWGEDYGCGEHRWGLVSSTQWGWCALDQPWSPQGKMLPVSTEGEGDPQGRPMAPEISMRPELIWNPVPFSSLTAQVLTALPSSPASQAAPPGR